MFDILDYEFYPISGTARKDFGPGNKLFAKEMVDDVLRLVPAGA